MKEYQTLKLLDRFKGGFEKLGIDYGVMRKIIQVKLTMDRRRVPTIYNQSYKKKKDAAESNEENHFIKALGLYALMGLLIVPLIVFGENYIFQMSILFGILMFLVMTSMISDFSSVLLDIRDKPILHTKPIKQKTFGMAKFIHVCIYLFFLTASLTLAPLVASLIKHGFGFFILFLGEVVLMNFFILVVTALIYLFILRFFDGEKLKDMINYVQIILTIVMTVGYQLVARSFNLMNLQIVFVPEWWQLLFPPIWFGAPFEWLLHGNAQWYFIVLSVMALLVPAASIFTYIKLMPYFEHQLQKLSHHGSGSKKKRGRLIHRLSRIICPGKEERTYFHFASNMMRNERDFKLRVYPSLGFSVIFPFIFIFNGLGNDNWSEVVAGKLYLTVYFSMIVIPTVVMMLKYSGTYKGAWIFKAAPVQSLAPIFSGTLKALLFRLYLPVYIIVSILLMALFGLRLIPDLAAVLLSAFLYVVLCYLTFKKAVPFSEPFSGADHGEGIKTIPLLLLLGVFCGVHYVSTLRDYGIYLYIVVLLLLDVWVWKKAFHVQR